MNIQLTTLLGLSLMVFSKYLPAGGLIESEEVPKISVEFTPNAKECAIRLGAPAEMQKVGKYSVNKDEEFLEYTLSIVYVESGFSGSAVSNKDARGLMQMTSIAVEDVKGKCSLKPLGNLTELHDTYTNIRYGTCYLQKLLTEMEGNWTRTLIAYNGGYRALQDYDKGLQINKETANYVLKVERALKSICRKDREEGK